LFDEEEFGVARAEFFENRERFVDRLMCAQYFDAERFDAMLLWLVSLKHFHDAKVEPMQAAYFLDADMISNNLETQSKYSKTQREAFLGALERWSKVLAEFRS